MSTLRRLAPLLLLALPIPALAQATQWDWAEGKTIADVGFEGLITVPESDLRNLLATKAKGTFSSQELSKDVVRLHKSGRFSGIAVRVLRTTAGDGVEVLFTLSERARLRRAPVLPAEVQDALEDEVLAQTITLKGGATYDPFVATRDGRNLEQKLKEQGYAFASVKHEVVARAEEDGVPPGLDLVYAIHLGPKVHVEEIEFEGNEQLDLDDLMDAKGPDALEVKEQEVFGFLEKGNFDADAFRRDMDRVARYYRSQGFLDARVYQKEQSLDLVGEELTLVVKVEEGERYRVRRVGIEGTRVLSEERLIREIGLRPGRPFLGTDLRDAMDRIKKLYGQRSYVHAEVDVDVTYDYERHLLDVTLTVIEGPKVRIEQIKIEGNEKTREKVIRRELSFYPGEFVDGDEIEASLARLGRLRYFNDVRIDFQPGSERGQEHLVLRVEEGRTGSFVVGGGFSTSAGFFGNIALIQNNFDLFAPPKSVRDILEGRFFSGGGQRLAITFQPGRQRSQITVEFTEPWLLGYPVVFDLEGFFRDRVREDWVETRFGGRVGLGYRLLPDLVARVSYRLELVRVADIEIDAVPDVIQVAGNNLISAVRTDLRLDKSRVDRYQVTYGGFSTGVYYEYVGGPLGGDHHFHRAGASFATWKTFFEWPGDHKWVIGLNTELDWERPIGKDPVPIFERFFTGGQGSIRGFEFRTVGPQLRDKPLGGDFRAIGSVGVSFPLFQDIVRGVLFLDAGGVASKVRGWRADDIRVAAGGGLRVKVPLFPAPVALDFAFPLRKQRDDDEQVFSFAVGFESQF